jgi:predicted small metal-binding protein
MSDELVARCDCGWSAQGPEDELIERIQAHARDTHGLEVTPEEALAQARPVEPESS